MTAHLSLERILPKQLRDAEASYFLAKYVTLANHLWDRLQWIASHPTNEEAERERSSVLSAVRDLWLALEWARDEYAPVAARELPVKLATAEPCDAFGLGLCLLALDLPVRTIALAPESQVAVNAATNLLLELGPRKPRG